jgi:hypothetical protein
LCRSTRIERRSTADRILNVIHAYLNLGQVFDFKELLRYPDKEDAIVPSPEPLFCYGIDPSDACASGYRMAAQIVLRHMDGRRAETFLFYPVLFLYRHHIELMLKNLIFASDHEAVRSVTSASPLTEREHEALQKGRPAHSLQRLWDQLRPKLEALGDGVVDRKQMAGVNAYIRQLNEIDPDSTGGRYATGINDTRDRLLKGRTPGIEIDLQDFGLAMERLSKYLDGIDMYLGAIIETYNDMAAEAYHDSSY